MRLPFRKRGPERDGAAEHSAPAEPAAAVPGDSTDPLGDAPGFAESAEMLSVGTHSRLERVSVRGAGGAVSSYLRLSVSDEALAEALRGFLLEAPEELTGFRDLLARDLPLCAALEPPGDTLLRAGHP
jgi:hypothetical protein